MAGKTIIMSTLKQILPLRTNGVALQAIAKAVALSRNTVKKYLRLIGVKELESAALLSDAEADCVAEYVVSAKSLSAFRSEAAGRNKEIHKEACGKGVVNFNLISEIIQDVEGTFTLLHVLNVE